MKSHRYCALNLKDTLYLLVYYGDVFYTSEDFVQNTGDGEKLAEWQNSVDLIYRLLMADIIECSPRLDPDGLLTFCRELSFISPWGENSSAWYDRDLRATELCKMLAKKHHLEDFDIGVPCPDFVDELENEFARAGVSWTGAPLIPIKTSGSTAP